MESSSLQQLIDILYQVFEALSARLPDLKLEELAVMLHKNMTLQTRYYHSLDHVLSFHDPENPIQSLAGLFHDIVYYQVDHGLSSEIEQVVGGYIRLQGDEISLVEQSFPDDRLFHLTMDVFGFKPGQELLIHGGLNEFLSALFMNKTLEGLIREPDLLNMSACVEATIPFRGKDERGQTSFQRLASRLRTINKQYHLGLQAAQIDAILRNAVGFANQDVSSFAEQDPARYLDSTWKLLPETNEALRSQKLYSISDYRQALAKMATFLSGLDPKWIFHQYKGWPEPAAFKEMELQARRNITIAGEYLRIKLATHTLLEALAEVTGGNAPLSLFMGEIPTGDETLKRMEDYLPSISPSEYIDHASPVYILLESGRESKPVFDLKNSPLSLYLYCNLPPEGLARMVEAGEDMCVGRKSASDFLSAVDGKIVAAVARACAEMARTRRPALLAIAASRDR
ncbi:MAG: hypothetical protein JXA78_10300 [Anaerolineales bacterium]|nr:hypothetical protein [Anaerolineales bacterium]